jgi:hypothetical protein
LFGLALPGLQHSHSKILRIENQAIKQETGLDITAAAFTLISSYSKYWNTTTLRASLKSHSWIKFLSTGNAPALAFIHHDQRAIALGTAMAE